MSALLYVDIPGILDAVRAAGAGAEIDSDPQVAANLKPLGGLAMWGDSKDGGVATADVYLEVRAGQLAAPDCSRAPAAFRSGGRPRTIH